MQRRTFLQVIAAGGMTMAIGEGNARATTFAPSAWLRIAPDGLITVMVAEAEMGQGVSTSIPMLVADALDADWTKVRFELAPPDAAYGRISTGGSTSIRKGASALIDAGKAARERLITAAAEKWKADPAKCGTERGVVVHPDGSERIGYGDLVTQAAAVQAKVTIAAAPHRLIGQPLARLDLPDKVNGAAIYGLDVKVEDALVARLARSPVFGGKLRSFDEAAARRVAGVKNVVAIDRGVAVVADGYWSASRGLRALAPKWDPGPGAKQSSKKISKALSRAVRGKAPGAIAAETGDVTAPAGKTVEAVYEVPFLAHAPMEPLNFTALVKNGKAELWGPTQKLTEAREVAARVAGLKLEQVTVHPTLIGGGFGRRLELDYVEEVVQIAQKVGAPVKLVWSRQDEVRHGFYRPCAMSWFRGGLDDQGRLVSWHNRIASPSILARLGASPPVDATSVEGARELPYSIPNFKVEYFVHDAKIPVGFWRSVGSSQNAYFTECFLDEMAAAAGVDPLTFRLSHIKDARSRAVLELAADKAGWSKPPRAGRHRGIAVARSFDSHVAQVAEISMEGGLRVHRVVCAIDCGAVVNPDTVAAQMEGGIVFGLSAAMRSAITIEKGRVKESNFHDYEVLRMHEAPDIEVHIVPSTAAMGGVGEPGVPPAAPALANAIFAATGKPVRKLPVPTAGTPRAPGEPHE